MPSTDSCRPAARSPRRIALDRATLKALAVHRSTAVERAAIGGFAFDVGSEVFGGRWVDSGA